MAKKVEEKLPKMISNKQEPLVSFRVNGSFIIGIYQGTISDFDVQIKYRQKQSDGTWTRIRTPKHIHWATDIMIKQYLEDAATSKLLDFLVDWWDNKAKPWKTAEEREAFLQPENLIGLATAEAAKYPELAGKGEYCVPSLILMAILLMSQEKTNKDDAFMFGNLLNQLKEHKDIFTVLSTASHR